MSLNNAFCREQLSRISGIALQAAGELDCSDQLPPMDLATFAVALDALEKRCAALGSRIAKLCAPLFAQAAADTEGESEPPAPEPREPPKRKKVRE